MSESQKPNAHVEDTLNYHLTLNELPFAILIRGEWGVGKTWFIKDYLKRFQTEHPDYATCRISLFGLNNSAELREKITAALLPGLLGLAGSALGTALHLVPDLTGLGAGLLEKAKGQKKKADQVLDKLAFRKKTVIVFDDFERCDIPPGLLLGAIDEFVNMDLVYVIIVSNEDYLDPHADEGAKDDAGQAASLRRAVYRNFREKIIGCCLTISPDLESAFQSQIAKQIPDVKDLCRLALERSKEAIFKRVKEKGKNNLRHLGRIITETLRLYRHQYGVQGYGTVLDELFEHQFLSAELIGTIAGLSIYLHGSGEPVKVVAEKMRRSKVTRMTQRLSAEDSAVYEHLGGLELSGLIVDFWWDYYEKGDIDDVFIYYFEYRLSPYEEYSALEVLSNWKSLSDLEFEEALRELDEDLNGRRYVYPEVALRAFRLKLQFVDYGLLQESKVDILAAAGHYAKYATLQNKSDTFRAMSLEDQLGNIIDDSPEFRKMEGMFRDRLLASQALRFQANFRELLNSMSAPKPAYSYGLYKWLNKNSGAADKFGDYFDPDEFFAAVMKAPVKRIPVLMSELAQVYLKFFSRGRNKEIPLRILTRIEELLKLELDKPDLPRILRVNLADSLLEFADIKGELAKRPQQY